MKTYFFLMCTFFTILTVPAFSDNADILQKRLNKINNFYANFTYLVKSVEGNIIQEGEGEFWVKRPNLFNCHMTVPDDNLLISDGKTLWFYNSFIKQVTATWLENTIPNTPFMLIIQNSRTAWDQYKIQKKGDQFLLVPKSNDSNLKHCFITVSTEGTIKTFTAVEHNGQHNTYQLIGHKNISVNIDKFKFILPKGATLDDQRQ